MVAAVEKTCRSMVVPHFEGVTVPDLKPQEVVVRTRRLHQSLDLQVSSPFWTHNPPMWLAGLHCSSLGWTSRSAIIRPLGRL
jgi:hypothetical protein